MARLTTKKRKALPKSDFVFPGTKAYPIDTRRRAANARSRIAQFGTPAQQAKVETATAKKYPGLGKPKKGKK